LLSPEQVFDAMDPRYEEFRRSLWSGSQQALKPAVVVQPRDAIQLAQVLNYCARTQTTFNVKSGGHGHSGINGGVQLDLARLNDVVVDPARSSVRVGAGNTWLAVYQKLEKMGLIAVGGRAATVGVGGFILGGGISFHAARYGWSIDNVRSFEVALVDGTVVTASRESKPDLFQALRGGGLNFGIVASFELELYPYRGMWGGPRMLDPVHIPQAIDAFLDFIPKLRADPKGHNILSLFHDGEAVQVAQFLAYTEPVNNPPMFDQLRNIPSTSESLEVTDLTVLAKAVAESQAGDGARQSLSTVTVKPDRQLLELACSLFEQEAANLSRIAQTTLEIHLLPPPFRLKDDCYGFSTTEEASIVLVFAFSTQEDVHDATVTRAQQKIIQKLKDASRPRGLLNPFLYMNYAAKWQNVHGTYGTENVNFLKKVASAYDPERVFQQLQPGPYKLWEAQPCTRFDHNRIAA
jgi:hypothetical protein